MADHVWELDKKYAFEVFTQNMFVEKCTRCGCLKITTNAWDIPRMKIVYKAPQFTWNPLKTLATEPSCPAQW